MTKAFILAKFFSANHIRALSTFRAHAFTGGMFRFDRVSGAFALTNFFRALYIRATAARFTNALAGMGRFYRMSCTLVFASFFRTSRV